MRTCDLRLGLALALACAAPEAPPPADIADSDEAPAEPPVVEPPADTAAPPVDTATLPDCADLRDACLMSGEWPEPCEALYQSCLEQPWPPGCADRWWTCIEGELPPLDCRLELLGCLSTPPEVIDAACATAYDDCLAQGRDPQGCEDALERCLTPPVDTDRPADTADPCAPLDAACAAAGVAPAWCLDVLDACRTTDPGAPCVDALLPCLTGPEPALCPDAWAACTTPPADTGTTCRELQTDCLITTGLADACALVHAACAGQDPDPALACSALGELCLRDAWAADCVQVEADCLVPSPCQEALTSCLIAGAPPEGCAADWLSCL